MSADADRARRVQDEVDKRLTLNWLIQGAAVHMGRTLHHLVRDELVALDPALPRLYDQFFVALLLQHWRGDAVVIYGWPTSFWWKARWAPWHPFRRHRLMSRYGGLLNREERRRVLARAREKGFTRWPVAFAVQLVYVMGRLNSIEARHRAEIERLMHRAASEAWGIPIEKLRGRLVERYQLTRDRFAKTKSFRGNLILATMVSWGAANPADGTVDAEALNGCLLAGELVKGTAELICLHGLSDLDDETYAEVMRRADRIEFEPWQIQTGGELWRRLLAALPPDVRPAEALMRLARLPPRGLEALMAAVIERPDEARERIAQLDDD